MGKYVAAVGGVIAVVVGIALLAIGLSQAAGPGSSQCVGDGCSDNPTVIAIPIGIVLLVIGMIAGGWGLSSIRTDRGVTGPLSAFGFMTGLGLVFFILGWICLYESRQGDPDGTFLFLGLLFGIMGLGFVASDAWSARGIVRRDRLRANGLKGTATVVGEKDTNWTVNNSPMVNLTIQVNLPGQAPFQTTKRTVISRLSVGALMPGAVLPVLADPANPKNVTIDWDSAASTGPDLAAGFSGGLPAGLSGLNFSGLQQGSVPGSGTLDPELLRNLGQAMTALAARAQSGQPLGATTIVVNGQQVNLGAPGADGGSPRIVSLPGHMLPTIVTLGSGALGSGALGSPMTPGSAAGIGAPPAATQSSFGGSDPGSGTGSAATPGSTADLGAQAGGSAAAVSPGPAAGTGETGRVTLDTIHDTGIDIGGARLYTFEMTVAITGRSGFRVKHAALVPQAQVPRLVQGASFPARIDPAQPSNLTVEWDH